MVQLYALIRKRLLLSLLLQFIFMLGFAAQSFGQDVIFRETMGTFLSNSPVPDHQQHFDNSLYTMTGTAFIYTAYQDDAQYSNASGGNVVSMFPGDDYQIEGINTQNFIGLTLSAAIWKDIDEAGLSIEYSIDGDNWSELNFLPVNSATWQQRTLTTATGNPLPATANLRLKFTNNSEGNTYEVDDIELIGTSTLTKITGFTPTSGPISTTITFTGTNLQNVTSASFESRDLLTFLSASPTEVKVQITRAPRVTTPQKIQLKKGSEILATSASEFTFTYSTITSITPASAVIGAEVIIKGTDLSSTSSVLFGGNANIPATFTVISDTEVKAIVPSNVTTGQVKVVTSLGTAPGPVFTVALPTITSMTPSYGLVGDEIIFTGTDLGTTSSVLFAGTSSSAIITDINASQVKARVPANAIDGKVRIITGVGTATSSEDFIVYRPIITSLSTTSGREAATVTIRGTRLLIGGTPTVKFAGDVAVTEVTTATVNGIDEVTVTVPVGAQTGSIKLTTTEGIAESGMFVVIRPVITFTASTAPEQVFPLKEFEAFLNNPSVVQQYQISGSNLEGAVFIAAPQYYQVALTGSEEAFSSTDPVFIPLNADGTIPATTIYVRYLPTENESHPGNITHTSVSLTENVAVSGHALTTLPVELISFTAEQQRNSTLLKWATASEKDNAYFEVEMSSSPAEGFAKLDRVESQVINSNTLTKYTYKHQFAGQGGTRYYRLKQTDLNGTFRYSNVVSVDAVAQELANQVKVAPNPLNYNSKIYFTAAASGKAILRLTAIAGKQVYQKEVEVQAGENEIQLPVYEKLKSGIYVLTIELDGKRHQVKVVKQ